MSAVRKNLTIVKYKVFYYKTDKNGTIIEPPFTMIMLGKSEEDIATKFNLKYRAKNYIYGWCYENEVFLSQ